MSSFGTISTGATQSWSGYDGNNYYGWTFGFTQTQTEYMGDVVGYGYPDATTNRLPNGTQIYVRGGIGGTYSGYVTVVPGTSYSVVVGAGSREANAGYPKAHSQGYVLLGFGGDI